MYRDLDVKFDKKNHPHYYDGYFEYYVSHERRVQIQKEIETNGFIIEKFTNGNGTDNNSGWTYGKPGDVTYNPNFKK